MLLRDAQKEKQSILPLWRPAVLLLAFAGLAGTLAWRAVDLQVLDKQFLLEQGEARHLRVVEIPAHRGAIVDRNGEPLAISSPVDSVWVNPKDFLSSGAAVGPLAKLLDLEPSWLTQRINERPDREFLYVKRHVNPEMGEKVMALKLPGVSLQREYRRFYPAGEVAAHVVGFTDVDDAGQEGVELSYDDHLRGEPGAKRVIKDRLGHIVEDVESLSEPSPGQSLTLTLDRRLQYLAYRELKAAMVEQRARSASLVLLDVTNGEILAMVNQPAYNPNNRGEINGTVSRNRAITDAYEPGSTVKPFAVAAALESGAFSAGSLVDTSPGYLRIGKFTIRDSRDLGKISLETLLQKSSTVGAAKLALAMPAEELWGLYSRLGFGVPTGVGFPGEASGSLPARPPKRDTERATLAYGYGLATTPLQLAQAYAAIAADGVRRPVSFVKREQVAVGEQVMPPSVARAVREMMEAVVVKGGTATQAHVPGYRIAGKSGTSKKAEAGGYAERRYVSYFAGMAPASKPRLAMVVMMDEPGAQYYYGGLVAAPVFSKVMAGALRLLNVAPDDLPALGTLIATTEAAR